MGQQADARFQCMDCKHLSRDEHRLRAAQVEMIAAEFDDADLCLSNPIRKRRDGHAVMRYLLLFIDRNSAE